MNAKTLALPSSHVAMLSQPEKVAEFVIEAAASAGDRPTVSPAASTRPTTSAPERARQEANM
jgi:hypothetical protein